MSLHARGTFDVRISAMELKTAGEQLGLWRLDKHFQGGLEATSAGHMLSFGSPSGSSAAAYVAIEVVAGALDGRQGTFVLQHRGLMRAGQSSLEVAVVAGSGTGQLAGLSGAMQIVIDKGAHSYDFEYSFEP